MNTFTMHDEVISKNSNYFQSFINIKGINIEHLINTSLIKKILWSNTLYTKLYRLDYPEETLGEPEKEGYSEIRDKIDQGG